MFCKVARKNRVEFYFPEMLSATFVQHVYGDLLACRFVRATGVMLVGVKIHDPRTLLTSLSPPNLRQLPLSSPLLPPTSPAPTPDPFPPNSI